MNPPITPQKQHRHRVRPRIDPRTGPLAQMIDELTEGFGGGEEELVVVVQDAFRNARQPL